MRTSTGRILIAAQQSATSAAAKLYIHYTATDILHTPLLTQALSNQVLHPSWVSKGVFAIKKKGPSSPYYSRTSGEKKNLRHEKHAKKMSACGHQPSCSNRLGESSRLAVFLLFYKEKGFYARPLVTPAGVI